MLARVKQIIDDPQSAYLRGLNKIRPEGLADRYGRLSLKQGIDQLYLILSFDCDTEEDEEVVWDVHSRLMDMGVMPVYAICGDLLRAGEKTYGRVAETGAEFINHGDIRHTYFDEEAETYKPCFFYHQQGRERVEKDIRDADLTIQDVLGCKPHGFRAPHFGTYRSVEDINFKHEIARDLGYKFCTTTVPEYGLRHGPASNQRGLYEFPVSGRGARDPFSILDTWSGIVHTKNGRSYLDDARAAADFYSKAGSGLLNFYADPSHVADSEEFFDAVKMWLEIATPINYSNLVQGLEGA